MPKLHDLLAPPTESPLDNTIEVFKIPHGEFNLEDWRCGIKQTAIEQTKRDGAVNNLVYFYSSHNKSPDHATVGIVRSHMFSQNDILRTLFGQALPALLTDVEAEAVVIVTQIRSARVECPSGNMENLLETANQAVQSGEAPLVECLCLQYETENEWAVEIYEITPGLGNGADLTRVEDEHLPPDVPHLLYVPTKNNEGDT